eukprot:5000188-Alexandrium_andersonii.AAC.1
MGTRARGSQISHAGLGIGAAGSAVEESKVSMPESGVRRMDIPLADSWLGCGVRQGRRNGR